MVEGGARSTPEQNSLIPPPLIRSQRQLTSPQPPTLSLNCQSMSQELPVNTESIIENKSIHEEKENVSITENEPTISNNCKQQRDMC